MNVPGNVPAYPVAWVARHKNKRKLIIARLWIEARELAMQHFQCGPDDLSIEKAK